MCVSVFKLSFIWDGLFNVIVHRCSYLMRLFFICWNLQLDINFIQCDIRNLVWRGNKMSASCFVVSCLMDNQCTSRVFREIKNSFNWFSVSHMFISHLHSTLPKDLDLRVSISFLGPIVDTVVMNPPFGTRRNGADMDFLSAALKVYLDFLFIYFLYPFLEL
jgi:hypothetical protein